MRGRHEAPRRIAGHKRTLGAVLALTLLFSMLPERVFAQSPELPSEYLCGHIHDEACGYSEGSEGLPCSHVHDESCGYVEGQPCIYIHVHDESCGYCEGSPCTYAHVHDESCGYNAETGEGCTDAHVHDGNCGYREASPCTDVHEHDESCGCAEASPCTDVHVHDESCGYVEGQPCTDVHVHDESCGYVEGQPCTHAHDESCGYVEAVPGTPCYHICEILSFNNYIPGEAIGSSEAALGLTAEDICAALPETLPGTLACAEGDVQIPVRWTCGEYTGEPGTYRFNAELTNEHCEYAAADDPLTEDVDESALPFIAVTVPEAAAEPEPSPSASPEPELTQQSLTDESGAVSVSGLLPEGAYLEVTEVAIETARELLVGTDAAEAEPSPEPVILFAYDIKIMLPAEAEGGEPTEHQPGAENPVTVTITPPEPIDAASVDVVHIAEDESTGETTAQTVANVAPTAGGAVEFAAAGFSVYVLTAAPATYTAYTGGDIFFYNNSFYTDAEHTSEAYKTNTGGAFGTMSELVGAVECDTTVYMQSGYTVTGTESIGSAAYAVTLMRYTGYAGSLITVSAGGVLTLSSITVDGNKSSVTATAPMVYVSGTLNINGGAALQNNNNTNGDIRGGGVSIASGGHLEMTGGVISGNVSATFGGGVYSFAGAATLSGGSISGNSAQKGGGILNTGGAALTVSGASITGNSAVEHGGGIYDDSGSTTTINSGEVNGNTAQTGGGIYNGMSSTLIITGGRVAGNNATSQAGGLFNGYLMTISGGSVIDNTAPISSNILSNKRAEEGTDSAIDHVMISGGTFTMDMQSGANAPTAGDGTTPVQCNDTSLSASACVTAVSVTYNSSFYDYGCNDMYTDTGGHLYLWLPEDSTVNSVTTYADGTYTVHDLNETTAHAKINYTSLAAGQTLTATLVGGTAQSYAWYRDGVETVTSTSYTTVANDVGHTFHVVISDGTYSYTSAGVTVAAPQISVTVPAVTLVTVNGNGICTVQDGEIMNNSLVPVYLVAVGFQWLTSDGSDADEIFSDYTAVTAKLTLSGNQYQFIGAAPPTQQLAGTTGVIAAKAGSTPGSLTVPWTFALGAGNYLKLAPALNSEVPVARISYTVDYRTAA